MNVWRIKRSDGCYHAGGHYCRKHRIGKLYWRKGDATSVKNVMEAEYLRMGVTITVEKWKLVPDED